MNGLLSKVARSTLLASLLSPLTTLASFAKDLTPEELANMAQASAVRMGCGVSIGIEDTVNVTGPAFIGVYAASALVGIAVRFLPKPVGERCWKIIRTSAHIYFWIGLPVTFVVANNFGTPFGSVAGALWTVSCLFAITAAARLIWRGGKALISFITKKKTKSTDSSKELFVRVEGNAVTLTQGSQSATRVVEDLSPVSTASNDEAETCLTR